jgi:tight adherence protein B
MKIIFICVLGFITAFLLVLSIEQWINKNKRKLHFRMKNLHVLPDKDITPDEGKEKGLNKGVQKVINFTGRILEKRGIIKPLEEKMLKADIPLKGEEYLIIWILSALVPGLLLLLITRNVVVGILLFLIGSIMPPIFVNMSEQKKLKKFNAQLVDSLSIISNSLRSGYSFMQSLELVSREMPSPIGKEFARTFREINLGTTTEEALNNLGNRIASDDLELIITAVLIQRQIGGNLSQILDSISHTIRERIRIQGEIKTLTAQGKISGLVIGLIPPFLISFIMILNPGYINPLFHSPYGLGMLAGGITSEVLGLLLIRKIIAIDV